jgi:hypothetical protein
LSDSSSLPSVIRRAEALLQEITEERPWYVGAWHDGQGGTVPCVNAAGITLAKMHVAPILPRAEAEANARFIAASPELVRELVAECKRLSLLIGSSRSAQEETMTKEQALSRMDTLGDPHGGNPQGRAE